MTDRLAAIAVSAAAHGVVLLGLLSSGLGQGDLISGEGLGEANAMSVSLVGSGSASSQAPAEDQTPSPEDTARSLLNALTSNTEPAKAPPAAQAFEPVSLDELLSERAEKPVKNTAQDGSGKTGGRSASPAQSAAGGASSAGRLWAVVEPCWRRMPQSRGAFVKLQVELDVFGRLSKPPRVLRTGEMTLDSKQLLAEAQALQALSACLPKASGLSLAGGHVLDFRNR